MGVGGGQGGEQGGGRGRGQLSGLEEINRLARGIPCDGNYTSSKKTAHREGRVEEMRRQSSVSYTKKD